MDLVSEAVKSQVSKANQYIYKKSKRKEINKKRSYLLSAEIVAVIVAIIFVFTCVYPQDILHKIQYRDNIKNNYCENHKIKLVRIPYIDFNKINANYLLNKIKQK